MTNPRSKNSILLLIDCAILSNASRRHLSFDLEADYAESDAFTALGYEDAPQLPMANQRQKAA